MADLEAVRDQLQQLRQRLAAKTITPEDYTRQREQITADLSAEDHIQLGVMAVSEPTEGATRQEPPAVAEAPAPPAPEMPAAADAMPAFPELDDSIFVDEVQPEPAPHQEPDEATEQPAPEPEAPTRRWLVPAIAGAALLVALLVVALLMNRSPSETPVVDTVSMVNQLLTDGQSRFDEGQGAQAVDLLVQGLGTLAPDDPGRDRVERRIAAYREELARPTPSPEPAVAAELPRSRTCSHRA